MPRPRDFGNIFNIFATTNFDYMFYLQRVENTVTFERIVACGWGKKKHGCLSVHMFGVFFPPWGLRRYLRAELAPLAINLFINYVSEIFIVYPPPYPPPHPHTHTPSLPSALKHIVAPVAKKSIPIIHPKDW